MPSHTALVALLALFVPLISSASGIDKPRRAADTTEKMRESPDNQRAERQREIEELNRRREELRGALANDAGPLSENALALIRLFQQSSLESASLALDVAGMAPLSATLEAVVRLDTAIRTDNQEHRLALALPIVLTALDRYAERDALARMALEITKHQASASVEAMQAVHDKEVSNFVGAAVDDLAKSSIDIGMLAMTLRSANEAAPGVAAVYDVARATGEFPSELKRFVALRGEGRDAALTELGNIERRLAELGAPSPTALGGNWWREAQKARNSADANGAAATVSVDTTTLTKTLTDAIRSKGEDGARKPVATFSMPSSGKKPTSSKPVGEKPEPVVPTTASAQSLTSAAPQRRVNPPTPLRASQETKAPPEDCSWIVDNIRDLRRSVASDRAYAARVAALGSHNEARVWRETASRTERENLPILFRMLKRCNPEADLKGL